MSEEVEVEVEVVGYLLEKGRTLSIWPAGSNDQQLMTVAQHQRIVEQLKEERGQLRAELAAIRASEPFAWAEFDGEGGYDLRLYEYNETYRDEYIERNGEKYRDWVQPLYTAPQREPDVAGLVSSANELVRQININDFTDSLGHSAKMLKALHDLTAALATYKGQTK